MSGVRIELTGTEKSLAALAAYASRAENARGMWENIGASLVTSATRRFETGIGPDGSPWPPSIRALAEGGKTLVLSARLMRSNTYIATDRGVEVGTNVVYAAIHQLGGEIHIPARNQQIHFKTNKRTGRTRFSKAKRATSSQTVSIGAHTVTMPARPWLGIDDNDGREVIRIAEEFVGGSDEE